jgi:hypothetical protein
MREMVYINRRKQIMSTDVKHLVDGFYEQLEKLKEYL